MNIDYDTLILDKLRVAATMAITHEVSASVASSLEVVIDHQIDRTVYALTAQVLGQRVDRQTANGTATAYFEYPATWWQHWKRDHQRAWYARWLVRRWPVRFAQTQRLATVSVDIERYRTFPDIEVPTAGRQVKVLIPGDFRWDWVSEPGGAS